MKQTILSMGYAMRENFKPSLAKVDYLTAYTEPCFLADSNDYGYFLYLGTGIEPEKHPLNEMIGMKPGGKVIYARRVVNIMNGDEYWDYEVYHEETDTYVVHSFADN
jgi:hypothetical protein